MQLKEKERKKGRKKGRKKERCGANYRNVSSLLLESRKKKVDEQLFCPLSFVKKLWMQM